MDLTNGPVLSSIFALAGVIATGFLSYLATRRTSKSDDEKRIDEREERYLSRTEEERDELRDLTRIMQEENARLREKLDAARVELFDLRTKEPPS